MQTESFKIVVAPVSFEVGPKIIVTFMPKASDAWANPVSLPTTLFAPLINAIDSRIDVFEARLTTSGTFSAISKHILSFFVPITTLSKPKLFLIFLQSLAYLSTDHCFCFQAAPGTITT